MAQLNRIYERTETGLHALDSVGPGLRAESRWLLGLIKSGGTHAETIRAGMRRYSDERIMELLTELEALQLVKSAAATSEHDLDFTCSLDLGALRAAHITTAR
jgi:hypothetical protein